MAPPRVDGRPPHPPPATGQEGLTSAEAAERLARGGPNRLVPERRSASRLRRLLQPFRDPMVLLLLIGEALLVFVVRSAARPVWRTDLLANRSVLPLVALSLLVLPATVLIPSVATILHLAPPAPGLWLPALAVAATATLWVEPLKWLAGRSRMPR